MSSNQKQGKVKKHLYCAVCLTTFSSRQSMQKHIITKNHTIPNCSILPDYLKNALPPEKTHASNIRKFDEGFTAEVYLLTVNTRERLREWIDTFMKINNCTYVRSRASKNSTASIIIQEHYQCEYHSTPNPVKRKKKTKGLNCKSTLYAVLKKSLHNVSWVNINFVHNHSLTSPELLRFKKPTEEIKKIFIRMFEDGATPTEALKYFKVHVRTQLTEKEFNNYSIDRSKVPDYDWVRHFFHKTVKKKYVIQKTPTLLESIKQTTETYASKDLVCEFLELGDGNFFIVIITPLMKRILQTKHAGNLLFIDNCGSVERFGLKIFLLFTEIHASEAPIGVIITSQETTIALVQAFRIYSDSIDSDAFGGRYKKGPSIILTDDNPVEISGIRTVFTDINDFFCTSHFLNSCHRWLLKPRNEVDTGDRKTIYSMIRRMIYASDEQTFSNIFAELTQNHENHVSVQRFARQIFEKRKKWAHCFRTDSILKDYETNCIVNFELRILKEQILEQIKSQSITQLIGFIISDFNYFYKQKFLDCCFRNLRYFKTNELTKDDLNNYVIIQISESIFVVYGKSKNIKYVINSDIGVCTCYVGVSGTFCKHQQLLSRSEKAFYTPMDYPSDDKSKTILYYIVTGDYSIPDNLNDANLRSIENIVDDDFNIIEEVVEDFPENGLIEECIVDSSTDDQLQELNDHIEDICKEIKSRKGYYIEGLINVNQQLCSIKNNSDAVLNAMFSFNKIT